MNTLKLNSYIGDALDRLDALLNPDLKLLAVPYDSATAQGCRQDLALLRSELQLAQAKKSAASETTFSLLDVLNTLKGNNAYWFRPVSWRGLGKAYTFQNGMIVQVPNPLCDFSQGLNLAPPDLAGEWEITSGMEVCGELEDSPTQWAGPA
ncbi:hypothetical protein [Hydrogenophaga sp. NFH-34]|uniref:hypothetical protein n=1 Tax=Hydrogenophaga sp. NFH-34 TaxID=2744446 RepID=UPI001F2C086E|nr:hypothetical protein [Hydrogenophaga sp. NFH-34]